jgi:RNA recognition motif-containing protein
LVLSGLPADITEEELRKLFPKAGKITLQDDGK